MFCFVLALVILSPISPTFGTVNAVVSSEATVSFNGHEYKYFTEKKNWHDAKSYCESLGGHLVTITSNEENDFVSSICADTAMIGLTDEANEGEWQWVTGESFGFSNFRLGEPNNEWNEDYVLIMPDNKQWNDGHLDRETWPFVCEWESTNGTNAVNNYFVSEITFQGHRYAISNTAMKWKEANDVCNRLGGHLASITSEAEQEAVSQLVESAHTLEAYWLGAYRDDNWIWITGENFSYTNWYQGEPNGSKKDFFLQMFAGFRYQNGHGKWDDTWNDGDHGGGIKQQGFVCEWEEAGALEDDYYIQLYVSSPSISLLNIIGEQVYLTGKLYKNNQQVKEWNAMTYAIENNTVVSVFDEGKNSEGCYIRLRGENVGTTKVTMYDLESGASASVNLRFESDSTLKKTYALHEIPHIDVAGIRLDENGNYRTNFYDLNGLYVCNYHLLETWDFNGNNRVSFDVYNSRYTHGAVDVFDANGNWIKSVKIEKNTSISGIWDTFESAAYMVADAINGVLLTYTADSFATSTHVDISIPDGGYFTISNNFAESPGALIYNVTDMMVLWAKGIAGLLFDGDTIADSVEANYINMIMNQDPVSRKILLDNLRNKMIEILGPLSQKLAGDILSAGEAMDITIAEFDDVVQEAGLASAYDVFTTVAGVGEEYFEAMAGPPGAVLSLMFSANELQDSLLQAIQVAGSIKRQYVAVQTMIHEIDGDAVKKYVGNFIDVTEDDWCAEYVRWATEHNITKGTTATTFSPNSICTTAQIITFLWRAAGSPEPNAITNPFPDVNEGSYFYKAALWAYDNGLIVSSNFNGGMHCTRATAVTFLWKLAGSPNSSLSPFKDVSSNASYAKAVAWAVANKITVGTSSDTFSPDRICTRAHIVAFLYRYSALGIPWGKSIGNGVSNNYNSPFKQKYWVIFTEGYRNSRVEVSTIDSSLPEDQIYIVWSSSMNLNNTSGSSGCDQYYLDENNGWVYMRNYWRLTDWATNVIASNLDIRDRSGNLILGKCQYSGINWNLVNSYR